MTDTVITNAEPTQGQSVNPHVDKILKEKKNAMERMRSLEQELETQKIKVAEYEENKLLEEKKYQEYAERYKKEAETYKEKFEKTQKTIVDSMKLGAFQNEAIKLGMDSKYIQEATKLIDLNKIHYDNDTRVVIGAEDEAKALLERFPPLFGGRTPGVSHDAPVGKMATLTLDEWKKLPYEERKKREGDLFDTLGIKRTR